MVMTDRTFITQHELPYTPRIREHVAEMSRLINAALVDSTFCERLLANPAKAVEDGYNGEHFNLSNLERQFVASVKARSLADFAIRWSKYSQDTVATAEFMDVLIPVRKVEC